MSVDLTAPNYSTELLTLGVTGALRYAPLAAAAPEKNLGAYDALHVDLGWLSDEGITEALSEESTDFIPWQATNSQRRQISSQEFTFQATVWSTTGLAAAMYYNKPVEEMTYDKESGVTRFVQGDKLPTDFRFRLGIDIIDGEKARRFWLPAASVQERGDLSYSKTDLIGYQFTFKTNFDPEVGYSIAREFREGWKLGAAGSIYETDKALADYGDWSGNVTGEGAEAPAGP